MTHTPGPWFAEKVGDDYRIVYGEGNWLAEVLSDGWSDEVASADAHLIAAAPDLLDAVRAALERSEYEHDREFFRAAIAKAGVRL